MGKLLVLLFGGAIGGDPALAVFGVKELLQRLNSVPAVIRPQVRNQGGGHANHSLFWQTLAPAAETRKPAGPHAAARDQASASKPIRTARCRPAASRFSRIGVWEHASYLSGEIAGREYVALFFSRDQLGFRNYRFTKLTK